MSSLRQFHGKIMSNYLVLAACPPSATGHFVAHYGLPQVGIEQCDDVIEVDEMFRQKLLRRLSKVLSKRFSGLACSTILLLHIFTLKAKRFMVQLFKSTAKGLSWIKVRTKCIQHYSLSKNCIHTSSCHVPIHMIEPWQWGMDGGLMFATPAPTFIIPSVSFTSP